ncbi:MAG: hypothetical protein HFH62_06400 [Lachnospiraceae bacterium]|nr:hypothetical protein [Lachnospiraceae bacterium]
MISLQDMTELLYINDAYYKINTAIFGEEIAISFHEGSLGALSRIHNLIERNASDKFKQHNHKKLGAIADDTSKTPEERAKILLGLK